LREKKGSSKDRKKTSKGYLRQQKAKEDQRLERTRLFESERGNLELKRGEQASVEKEKERQEKEKERQLELEREEKTRRLELEREERARQEKGRESLKWIDRKEKCR